MLYKVRFTLVHAGKYRTEDKIDNTQLNTYKKKKTRQNTAKQNYSGSVTFYDTQAVNEVGLFYTTPEPMWACQTSNRVTFCSWKRWDIWCDFFLSPLLYSIHKHFFFNFCPKSL